jgi:hypothetical protein
VSAIGPKRTSVVALQMSAFGGIADIHSAESNIRFKAQYDVAGPGVPTVSLNFSNNLRRVELLKELTQLMDEPDSKGVNLKVPERACLDLVGTGWFPGLVAGFEKRSGRC